MKKDSITTRIFTALCFLMLLIAFFLSFPVSDIVEIFGRDPLLGLVLLAYSLGYALVIISVLTSSRQLIAVGIIMLALTPTRSFISAITISSNPLRSSIGLLKIGAYIILALGFFQKKRTKQFAFLASVIFILYSILEVVSWNRFSDYGAIYDIYKRFNDSYAFPCISFYLAAVSLDDCSKDESSSKALSNPSNDRIERLTKLKELLDMGAITQEEFNGKKKQILGEQT